MKPVFKISPVPRKPRYISVKEAAEYLHVSERTIRRMIKDGRLSGHRYDHSSFIRVDLNELKDRLRPSR